jgi:hypothetical protein
MSQFHIVTTTTDTQDELTDADLDRLAIQVGRIQRLVNDPVALMSRVQALLAGTAERLI